MIRWTDRDPRSLYGGWHELAGETFRVVGYSRAEDAYLGATQDGRELIVHARAMAEARGVPEPAVPSAAEGLAPDVVGAVVGYRSWHVQDDGALSSFAQTTDWEHGTNRARCLARPHDAPQRMCGCGLYAVHHPVMAPGVSGGVSGGVLPRPVIGAVRGWGALEVHALGFRAEFAEVVALVDGPDARRWAEEEDGEVALVPDLRSLWEFGRERVVPRALLPQPEESSADIIFGPGAEAAAERGDEEMRASGPAPATPGGHREWSEYALPMLALLNIATGVAFMLASGWPKGLVNLAVAAWLGGCWAYAAARSR